MTDPVIHRVTQLDLVCREWSWPFADQRRAEIDAHFAAKRADKPDMFNGTVLLGRHARFTDDRLQAEYFKTDFASFLAWRDWGFPDREVFNGFGMGALRCGDGAFVLGEMGPRTANAGRIYFASGTPDPNDLRGDILDIAGSVLREVEEETGLTPASFRVDPQWHCVVSGVSIAMMQILDADLSGDEMRAVIRANLATQDNPELSDIHLVRSAADFRPTMPLFVTAFMADRFALA